MAPRVTLALALLLSTLGCGGGTPSAPSPSPTPPRDVEALLREMTLDEKVGQMAQADRSYLRSEADIRELLPRLAAERRRLLAPGQDGPGLGRDVRPLPVDRPRDAAAHPARLRHRRRPRPQQRGRGRHLPPQHRPRLHARRRARRARGARHGRGGRGHGDRLDLLALHRGRARRALGADVRELRRDARARLGDGRGRGARLPAHDPGLRQALPRRRRHGRRPRPGRRADGRGDAAGASTCPATARRSRPASAR